MEYIVAQYRIRTTGNFSDIVACGVKGFAPFTVEADATQSATLDLYTECNIDKSAFNSLAELSRFGFYDRAAGCEKPLSKESFTKFGSQLPLAIDAFLSEEEA